MIRKRQGQVTVEYAVMMIILIGALLSISSYFKRGVQGRWKETIDDMGDQYDPLYTNGSIRHEILANTVTIITTINANGGFWTMRDDVSNSVEKKTGSMAIGAY